MIHLAIKDEGQNLAAGHWEKQALGTVGSSLIGELGHTFSPLYVTKVFRGSKVHESQEARRRAVLIASQTHLKPPRRPPLQPFHRLRGI